MVDEETHRDEMTGLATHRAFQQAFDEATARAEQEGARVSLAIADIDWFGKLNAEHGEKAGDEAIRTVARHLVAATAGRGELFRVGGEEFAAILYGTEKEDAFLLAETARSAFDAANPHALAADGGEAAIAFTFSTGIATYPDDGTRARDVVRKADEALYRAKETGRNRVCLAREERMVTKTSYYTQSQLERLERLAKREGGGEAVLLREALDDLLRKYLVREV